MKYSLRRGYGLALLCTAFLLSCVTSPTGRSQLMLFPDSEMDTMGVTAFTEIKSKMKASTNKRTERYVRCVADAITRQLPQDSQGSWEVVVFDEDSANAFALPGRKIGVHTGLLKVATNQDQLAAVVGHEVAHVLAGHGNERISTAYATQTGLQIIEALGSSGSSGQSELIGLLGAGAQVGVLLPFSRAQETEADVLGLDMMAKAGFNPEQSLELWKNMSENSDGQPPEIISTHPSHSTRITNLEQQLQKSRPIYLQARSQGEKPRCGP